MSQDLEILANDRTEQEKNIADQEMALDEEKKKQKIARTGQQAEQPNEPAQARELHREG